MRSSSVVGPTHPTTREVPRSLQLESQAGLIVVVMFIQGDMRVDLLAKTCTEENLHRWLLRSLELLT